MATASLFTDVGRSRRHGHGALNGMGAGMDGGAQDGHVTDSPVEDQREPIEQLRLPTLLALGGAVAGLLVAAMARWATGAGARRRSGVARRQLNAAATEVGRELIIAPLDAELATLSRLHELVRRLRR